MVRGSSSADGSKTQSLALSFTIMCLDIDLLAIDHSEVPSDKNGSLLSFHALCARALARTNKNLDYGIITHKNNWFLVLASRERPSKSTSSACPVTNRAPVETDAL